MPALLLGTAHGVRSIVKILRNPVPADEARSIATSTNPLPSFVSNLTQKSPGFTATEKENNKGISSFQIYEELLEIIDRIAIERREHREIPFNFIRGTRILTRHGKTSYPLGGGDKFPRSFRSRIVEKAI